MTDNFPELPDFLNRKLNPREYTEAEMRLIRREKRRASSIVWPSEKQIAKAMRKRERERREDAASKIELGSMRVRRGQ